MSYRAGLVAVVGKPNVGKSTLINRLVGQKIAITSRKPQTTRHRTLGVLTRDDAQFVFVDTPGYQRKHGGALNKALNRTVTDSLRDIDVVLFVVAADRYDDADESVRTLLPTDVPVILVINKVDQLARKDLLLPLIADLNQRGTFAEIVPVSAQEGTQCDDVLNTVAQYLPESEPLFDAEQVTDRSERFMAAEFVREKVFRLTGDELPYGVEVVVERFKVEHGVRHIHCLVIVAKEAHKAMIIGSGGERLKRIASEARADMEREFGGSVFLEVWVRVEAGWSRNRDMVRKYGYG